MEFLEQEHISPALLDGVRAYRAQYPAEPALQGRIPQPRFLPQPRSQRQRISTDESP